MNDQLESDLRAALRERAELVPTASVLRLSGMDYHPRRHRLRPPVAIGATATAGAAAGAAALVISLGAGATNAFAGWTAKPTAPTPGQLQAAQASCASGGSSISGLPLKLADTRGPFTFSVYANDQTSATCIEGPSLRAVSISSSSGPVSVPDGQIVVTTAHVSPHANQSYSFAEGRTGAGVSAVTLTLDDGTAVEATVSNGWFVAWWPGGNGVKSAQIATPAGVKTQSVSLPAFGSPPPGGGVNGGGSGSSAGSGSAGGSASPGGIGGGQYEQSFGSSQ